MSASSSAVRARARALLGALGCSRAEVAALAILATGTVVALVLLWALAGVGPGPRLAAGVPAGVETPAGPASDAAQGTVGLHLEVGSEEIVVHVAGRVERPGLQRLPSAARVADALEAAGGPTADAVLDTLNLARVLHDGEQLVVPGSDEAHDPAGAGDPAAAPPASTALRPDGTLDLNRASAAELETLPGIGPVMAARIVEHRAANGPFTVLGDLRQVRGVGEKTFQALVDHLSL
jgi:competence protein ComEA